MRPSLVQAAQEVLDAWEQDAEGWDEELGYGGACDAVASAMGDVLAQHGIDSIPGGQDGDDHAWLIAVQDGQAIGLDIPASIYESGAGFVWRKRAGVRLSLRDVVTFPVSLPLAA